MFAKDIMSKDVLSVTPDTTVYRAARLVVDNKISGVPVLSEEGELMGIVTEKDLLVILDFLGVHQAKDALISECMSKDVIACSQDTPVQDISRLLVQKNIKRVPIVKEGKLLGIVSRRDILNGML